MTLRLSTIIACAALQCGCHDQRAATSLPQRAYVWQREWTPAVSDAVKNVATSKLDGIVLLGAEIVWDHGQPKPVRSNIDWRSVKTLNKPVGIAMRVAPFGGPFEEQGEITRVLTETAKSLLDKMKNEQVPCGEFQLDFDCAQKKLSGYALWLKALRESVRPCRLVITTLPAWLDEPEFAKLLNYTDGYILQVHSIPPSRPAADALVCEPDRARLWVKKAAVLSHPFEVALSTYSAIVGYDDVGRLRGVALDAVQPSWPAGTRLMRLDSDAESLSALVAEWRAAHPPQMKGVIWYRLPVATDQRNWRNETFNAVIEGRALQHRLIAKFTDANPADLTLVNEGDIDENFAGKVVVRWQGDAPTASDALRGWSVRIEERQAEFICEQPLRLPPGTSRGIGWLRFDQRASLHVEIIR